jgi:hypothetical protein
MITDLTSTLQSNLPHRHYHNPHAKLAHVIIVYRDVQKMGKYSHKALGVNAGHTCKVLRKNGVLCDPLGLWPASDLVKELKRFPTATHVVIEAPWIPVDIIAGALRDLPQIHFLVRAHSQIGFLQVEPGAVTNLRDLMLMQDGELNLTVAANSSRLSDIYENVYQGRCLHLPNLYDLERPRTKLAQAHTHRRLVIGSFGALRLLKNHTTSAAAALIIAKRRRCDLEFWINVGREETSGGKDVLPTLRNMFLGLPWARLVEQPWEPWAGFRRIISSMDLLMQPSFTETFNITAADAVAEGVPVVGGDAIEWLPEEWKARPDDAHNVARIGMALLSDPGAPADGLTALTANQKTAIGIWLSYLGKNPT